jgi:hypothetical protein
MVYPLESKFCNTQAASMTYLSSGKSERQETVVWWQFRAAQSTICSLVGKGRMLFCCLHTPQQTYVRPTITRLPFGWQNIGISYFVMCQAAGCEISTICNVRGAFHTGRGSTPVGHIPVGRGSVRLQAVKYQQSVTSAVLFTLAEAALQLAISWLAEAVSRLPAVNYQQSGEVCGAFHTGRGSSPLGPILAGSDKAADCKLLTNCKVCVAFHTSRGSSPLGSILAGIESVQAAGL